MTKSEAKQLRTDFMNTFALERWAAASPTMALRALDSNMRRWYAEAKQQFRKEFPTIQEVIGD